MAINTLKFAQKFSGELDKMVVQKSVTGFMADNTMRAKFVGAKTVIVPDIDFVGLTDYDRDNGFTSGAITVAQQPFTLSQDRARSLQIDREDMDETGISNLAGQVMGEYVKTKVIPEMDSYILSKLVQIAIDKKNTITLDATKAYAQFVELVNKVQGKTGFDTEIVSFVNPAVYAAFMNSTELQRHITVSNFKQGEIDLKVNAINGVAIIPVAGGRMKTKYTDDAENGGLKPTEDAKDVGILVLPKTAAHLVKKTEEIRVFTPENNIKADAYKFDYRVYYDAFVKKSNLEHIAAAISQ
ncbi:MAG: hypothetical protein J6C27_00895 [Clostridia bacterium]|nr:hypothetical protein [Clostridia bacterium]